MEFGQQLPKLDLTTFLLSISTAALQALGDDQKDLVFAKQNIELLELMHEKTKGNRTPEEDKLIDQLVFQLRMTYVESEKKFSTQP